VLTEFFLTGLRARVNARQGPALSGPMPFFCASSFQEAMAKRAKDHNAASAVADLPPRSCPSIRLLGRMAPIRMAQGIRAFSRSRFARRSLAGVLEFHAVMGDLAKSSGEAREKSVLTVCGIRFDAPPAAWEGAFLFNPFAKIPRIAASSQEGVSENHARFWQDCLYRAHSRFFRAAAKRRVDFAA